MDNSGLESIMYQLETENEMLRKELNSIKSQNKMPEVAYNFILLSKSPLRITGVLIAEGVWKGVKYEYEELKKALPKFYNLKGMVLHGQSQKYQDRIIGKLTKVIPNDTLKALLFEADVTDADAIEDIKSGVFDSVSIKIKTNELDTSVNPPIGRDYIPYEWSLTFSPACETCLIFSVEELSRNVFNIANSQDTNDGDSMVDINILDVLELEKSYKDFLKECMSQGNDLKTCALKWKEMKTKEQPQYEKIVCSVCGSEFTTIDEFKKHWETVEKEKYGEYEEYKEKKNNELSAQTEQPKEQQPQTTAQQQAQPSQSQQVAEVVDKKTFEVQSVQTETKIEEPKEIKLVIEVRNQVGEDVKVGERKEGEAIREQIQPEPKKEEPQKQKLTLDEIRKIAKVNNIDLKTISAELLLASLEEEEHK